MGRDLVMAVVMVVVILLEHNLVILLTTLHVLVCLCIGLKYQGCKRLG